MKSRLTLAAAAVLLFASAQLGDTARAHHTGNVHQGEPQTFIVDANLCSGPSSGMVTGNENASLLPLGCSGEDLGVGSAAGNTTSFLLPFGNRLSNRTTYIQASLASAATIPDSTVVGSVKANLNIGCDATADYLLDSTSTLPITDLQDAGLVGEQLVELPLASTFPGIPEWTVYVRYQATVDYVALGGSVPILLPIPLTYQVVTQAPPWGSVFAVTHMIPALTGPPDAQAGGCLDSAFSFEENISGSWWSNPGAAGLYANWATELSVHGLQDEQVQTFTYTTSCKHIGGPVADTDNDCWPDASDTNDADRDQDDDGLLDGVEVAWANSSCVNDADCDNDGRTDAEEMVGPGRFLSSPFSADSDSDGLLDAGFNLDCDGDGEPDMPIEDLNKGSGTGRNRVSLGIVYCRPDGTSTNQSACSHPFVLESCGGRPFGNVGAASADNCPNYANAPQTNTANTLLDLDSIPVVGDSNGRFNGLADNTHPHGRYQGDACDADADNDLASSVAEAGSLWWDATGGASGQIFCNNAGLGTPIVLNPSNRDTDGDGTVDGVECRVATDPTNAASKPLSLAADEQVFFRTVNLTRPDGTILVTLDDDDNLTNLAEVRGGLFASLRDSDRDGCADVVELADMDGNRSANDADRLAAARAVLGITPFTGGLTAEEIRTVDVDHSGATSDADRLLVTRVVLSDVLSTVLDTQQNCTAARIGYDAN